MSCDVGKPTEDWRMSCDVGEMTERLENELLHPFRHFTYVRTHSPTFRRFTYIAAHSLTLPLLHLCHSSFSNSSFASLTSQTLHLRHLASQP